MADNFLTETLKNVRFVWEYFKINIASQFEYRFSFVFTALSMILNNIVWIFFWLIIFARFRDINGWVFKDLLLLYGIITIAIGLSGMFFGNRFHMAQNIERGGLDFYLALPKDVLLHVLVTRFAVGGIGDFLFGVVVAAFVISWKQIPLFVLLVLLSFMIFMAFSILAGSLTFVLGRASALERNLLMGILTFGVYPISIFEGVTKIILLTVIPAGFMSGIPVQILNQFSWKWLLIMIFVAFAFLFISIKVFNLGLRKYESGSLIVERM